MSKELIREYKKLHDKGGYGTGDPRIEEIIAKLLKSDTGELPENVLDFGCGRSRLLENIGIENPTRYDPAIKEYSDLPPEGQIFDAVVCNDVLEHIPEDEVGVFLKKVTSYAARSIFTIHCAKARTILSNGQNAHCTVRGSGWWVRELEKIHKVLQLEQVTQDKFVISSCDYG